MPLISLLMPVLQFRQKLKVYVDNHGVCDAWPVQRQTYGTFPAYDGTHCIDPRRDGQAELTWMADNVQRRSPIPVLTGLGVRQLR